MDEEYKKMMDEWRAKSNANINKMWNNLPAGIYTVTNLSTNVGVTYKRMMSFLEQNNISINKKDVGKKHRCYVVKG